MSWRVMRHHFDGSVHAETFPTGDRSKAERQMADLIATWPGMATELFIEEVVRVAQPPLVETEDMLDREIRNAARRRRYAQKKGAARG